MGREPPSPHLPSPYPRGFLHRSFRNPNTGGTSWSLNHAVEINFLLPWGDSKKIPVAVVDITRTHPFEFLSHATHPRNHRIPIYRLFFCLFCECIFLIIFFRLNLITGYGNTTLLISAGQACSYGKIKVGSAEICGKRKRKRKEDVCKRRNREIQNRNQPRNTITGHHYRGSRL